MTHRKPDTSNDSSLARRQGMDDRELRENAEANQKSRESAARDWDKAASHRKDDADTPPASTQTRPGKGNFPPGVDARDLHDPGSRREAKPSGRNES